MRKLLIAVASVVAFAALGLGVAAAHDNSSKTKVTIAYHLGPAPYYEGTNFHGKVKSHHHKCIKHRKVTVKRKKSGNDQKIGSDKSNNKGKWKVLTGPVPSGKYYAVAKKKTLGNGHVCKKGKSPTIAVP
jgi:hypothetical protein